jgi:hypothetical protein
MNVCAGVQEHVHDLVATLSGCPHQRGVPVGIRYIRIYPGTQALLYQPLVSFRRRLYECIGAQLSFVIKIPFLIARFSRTFQSNGFSFEHHSKPPIDE